MTKKIIKADVTIGVHPNNHSLFVLRRTGILENILKEHNATVAWVDYIEGAKTPQRLATGEIDFGGTGATPPLTAQATDIDIVYVAVSNPRPASGALVVRKESPIQSVAELKGLRIALTEGSWHTSFLANALDKEGLLYKEVVRVDLANEGANALLAGEVDAWIGNDPQLTELENKGLVRTLVSLDTYISHRSVWFANRSFATSKPQILESVVEALQQADLWIQENTREAAELFARDLPNWPSVDSWEAALRRRPWGLQPITEEFIAEQQRAADLLARQNILPKKIVVSDAVLPNAAEIGGK